MTPKKKNFDMANTTQEEEEEEGGGGGGGGGGRCLLFVCSFVCNQKHFDITRA
jgi:hypothetical protein